MIARAGLGTIVSQRGNSLVKTSLVSSGYNSGVGARRSEKKSENGGQRLAIKEFRWLNQWIFRRISF